MTDAKEPCPKCGGSGWKPHKDANGNRVWLPLMNDALPCECGALARRYEAEKAALHPQPQKEQPHGVKTCDDPACVPHKRCAACLQRWTAETEAEARNAGVTPCRAKQTTTGWYCDCMHPEPHCKPFAAGGVGGSDGR